MVDALKLHEAVHLCAEALVEPQGVAAVSGRGHQGRSPRKEGGSAGDQPPVESDPEGTPVATCSPDPVGFGGSPDGHRPRPGGVVFGAGVSLAELRKGSGPVQRDPREAKLTGPSKSVPSSKFFQHFMIKEIPTCS